MAQAASRFENSQRRSFLRSGAVRSVSRMNSDASATKHARDTISPGKSISNPPPRSDQTFRSKSDIRDQDEEVFVAIPGRRQERIIDRGGYVREPESNDQDSENLPL